MSNQSPMPPARNQRKRKVLPWAVGIIAALAVIGIVQNASKGGTAPVTSSPTSITTPSVAYPSTTLSATTSATAPSASALPSVPAAPLPSRAMVPNVVGMNHQAAQDTLQAAGFYLLHEEDATGRGRLLIWDRNWQVVSQSVRGGTAISTDTPITLRSKKIGE